MDEFRARLTAIQAREGLSDGQMAVRLRITRTLWHGIRTGKLRITERVAIRAVVAFPELGGLLLVAAPQWVAA